VRRTKTEKRNELTAGTWIGSPVTTVVQVVFLCLRARVYKVLAKILLWLTVLFICLIWHVTTRCPPLKVELSLPYVQPHVVTRESYFVPMCFFQAANAGGLYAYGIKCVKTLWISGNTLFSKQVRRVIWISLIQINGKNQDAKIQTQVGVTLHVHRVQ
jgi:hypothetical protein